jgi:UDP-glucose 4-epimerase
VDEKLIQDESWGRQKMRLTGKALKILVVGGAGYIGSHMALCLQHAGYQPIILDNLSTGHRDAALTTPLIIGEMNDSVLLDEIFAKHEFTAVMHFASCIETAESVHDPLKYYQNNVAATLPLLRAVVKHQVKHFIFSSSAAVYGNPETDYISETHTLKPINPYGRTKLMVESIIHDVAIAHVCHYAILRYFNAAGADSFQRLGERHQPESHLLPLILQVAAGKKPAITIYGSNYPTTDGTCIRDYIHVSDVCTAHLRALESLLSKQENIICNLGTGQGYSVQQVIAAARDVTGCDIPVITGMPRKGDPARLVANPELAKNILLWQPQFSDIHTIITDAWQFMCSSARERCEMSS